VAVARRTADGSGEKDGGHGRQRRGSCVWGELCSVLQCVSRENVIACGSTWVDLSIYRTGRVRAGLKKISVFSGRKNPAYDHPTGRIGPQFSGRARAWAVRPHIL
jgi:hypothetical protein